MRKPCNRVEADALRKMGVRVWGRKEVVSLWLVTKWADGKHPRRVPRQLSETTLGRIYFRS